MVVLPCTPWVWASALLPGADAPSQGPGGDEGAACFLVASQGEDHTGGEAGCGQPDRGPAGTSPSHAGTGTHRSGVLMIWSYAAFSACTTSAICCAISSME